MRANALLLLVAACGDNHRVIPDGSQCEPMRAPAPPPDLDPVIEARVDVLLARMTLEDKLGQLHGADFYPDGLWLSDANPGLSIPGFHMADGPRGVHVGHSTCFPVAMARGASFDRELEQAVGDAVGVETAAHGGDVILAPTVNVLRHPRWGRSQETYGEDPYMIGELGAAFVDGAQHHVIASVKHFALNSIEDTRFDLDVVVDERSLREVYLPQFETIVRRSHAASMMTGYNKINHVYSAEQPLLRDVVKDEWGFSGFVMSDWFGVHSGAPSVIAGLDMEMPGHDWLNEQLADSVANCELPTSAVDDAVRRILRTKLAFHLDAPTPVDPSAIESPANIRLALQAEREAIVMLRNQGVLPLGSTGTVAVVGVLADTPNLGDHISSDVIPSHVVTPLGGLRARLGDARVVHVPSDTLDAITRAQVTAADVAIVVVGLTAEDEGEGIPGLPGDRETLALSATQQALIHDVAQANAHTVVLIEGGGAVLTSSWIDEVAAALVVWYPGEEGGTAIAEILAGDIAPSGRLPMTFPVAEEDLPPFDNHSLEVEYGYFHGYRWMDRFGKTPAFPFGFGLSYGTVDYTTLALAASSLSRDDTLQATVTLTSVGLTGDEVVQLYIEPPAGPVPRAVRELRNFTRVALTPGASKSVTLEVPIASLARYEPTSHRWIVDPGTYRVAVGRSARDLPLAATFDVH